MLRRIVSAALSAIVLAGGLMAVSTVPASAAGPDCYGASCTGIDPDMTNCKADAKNIGSMDVGGNGMLDLRWSRFCNASWGRFTVYPAQDMFNSLIGTGISQARVTAWNPGGASQPVASQSYNLFGTSWWTNMVDGSIRSCTGVELFSQDGPETESGLYSGNESLGWTWGPCVD